MTNASKVLYYLIVRTVLFDWKKNIWQNSRVEPNNLLSLEEMRTKILMSGVMADIMSELYRRKTSVYEDKVTLKNNDLWCDGKLLVGDSK